MREVSSCKRVWLISRHPAVSDWLAEQGCVVYARIEHLDGQLLGQMQEGDCVIGNLPLSWIEKLNGIGVRYLNLDLRVPMVWRGQELDLQRLKQCHPCLMEYRVISGEKLV